jgi:hypothetical protein
MTAEEFQFAARSLDDLLRNGPGPIPEETAEAFAKALEEVPAGQYMCGCEWCGGIVPHYCPKHLQPVCFEIREPRK